MEMSFIGRVGDRIPKSDEWLNDSSVWHRQTSIMDDRVGHAGLLTPWLKYSTAKHLTPPLIFRAFPKCRWKVCHLGTTWHLHLIFKISFCSSLTCLMSIHPFFYFFGLNPVMESERQKERGTEKLWGNNIDRKKMWDKTSEPNECCIICTAMEPFFLEIRRQHKWSFSPSKHRAARVVLSLSLFKLYVGVGVTGQISVY